MLDSLVIDAAAASRVNLNGNLIVNHLEGLRAAVLAGAGIALLGTEVVGDDIESGRLVPVLLDAVPPRGADLRGLREPSSRVREGAFVRRLPGGAFREVAVARRSNRACACCRSRG